MDALLNFISVFLTAVFGFIVTRLIGAIAVVIAGNFAISLLTRTLRLSLIRTRVKPALTDLGIAMVRGLGLLIILSGVLQSLGLDQIALAIGGSISLIALGIATAASGNLGDIIAGVFLASDPDFGTGFVITTNTITGIIEHVDLRKTRIRTENGKLHILPNKAVESNLWVVEQRPSAATPTPIFHGRPHLPQAPHMQHPAQPPRPPEPPIDPGSTQPNRPPG